MRALVASIFCLLLIASASEASRHTRRSHARHSRHAHKRRAARKHLAAKGKKLAQAGRPIDVNTSDPLGGLDGY